MGEWGGLKARDDSTVSLAKLLGAAVATADAKGAKSDFPVRKRWYALTPSLAVPKV